MRSRNAGSSFRSAERVAIVATGSAFFMVILDTTVVNLALPSIAAELHVTLTGLQWIVDGYALVFASLLLGQVHWAIGLAPSLCFFSACLSSR
jgi:MFS family permease